MTLTPVERRSMEALKPLSPRERSICSLLSTRGLSDKAIAEQLSISAHTVRQHLKAIRRKRPDWVSRYQIMAMFPVEATSLKVVIPQNGQVTKRRTVRR